MHWKYLHIFQLWSVSYDIPRIHDLDFTKYNFLVFLVFITKSPKFVNIENSSLFKSILLHIQENIFILFINVKNFFFTFAASNWVLRSYEVKINHMKISKKHSAAVIFCLCSVQTFSLTANYILFFQFQFR